MLTHTHETNGTARTIEASGISALIANLIEEAVQMWQRGDEARSEARGIRRFAGLPSVSDSRVEDDLLDQHIGGGGDRVDCADFRAVAEFRAAGLDRMAATCFAEAERLEAMARQLGAPAQVSAPPASGKVPPMPSRLAAEMEAWAANEITDEEAAAHAEATHEPAAASPLAEMLDEVTQPDGWIDDTDSPEGTAALAAAGILGGPAPIAHEEAETVATTAANGPALEAPPAPLAPALAALVEEQAKEMATEDAPAQPSEFDGDEEAILEILAGGDAREKEVREKAGLPAKPFNAALKRLRNAGHVARKAGKLSRV